MRPHEYYQSDQKGLSDQKTSATQHLTRMNAVKITTGDRRSVCLQKIFKPRLIIMRLLTVN